MATAWALEMVDQLKAAKTRERRSILERFAEHTGKSVQHLYRVAKKNGFSSGRKKRVDAGTLKSELTDEQVDFITGLISVTKRDKKGCIMPVERALEIAVDNGVIEAEQISVGGMQRILRERQLSARHLDAPEPHTEMSSPHPNHTHVLDASYCILYYFKNGTLGIERDRDLYKNKPHNLAKRKKKIIRYLLVDHCTGAFHLHYCEAEGEDQMGVSELLRHAWGKNENPKLPFRGVPKYLLMDRGAANTSKAIIAMLERLDVEVPEGMPYNKKRQGAVESMHDKIERHFESGLRIQPAQDIDTLNEWARDWMVRFQANRNHTRHKMSRTQAWLKITREQLRELPDERILQDLFANPEEDRTVDGRYRISYRGKEYDLRHVEGLFPRAKVRVVLKPWTWPVVEVRYGDTAWEARPIEKDAWGFSVELSAEIGKEFKAVHESEAQRAVKRITATAYDEGDLDKRGEPKKGAVPYAGTRVFGHHADKVDLEFIPRLGTPREITRDGGERMVPVMEVLKRVRGEIGTVPAELNGRIRRECGESVKASELDGLVTRYSQGARHASSGENHRLEAM